MPQQLQPSPRNRTTAIVGGVAAALVLGVGAFVVFGGDDDKTITGASTTAVVSSIPNPASTLPPTSVTVTTIAESTSTTAVSTTMVATTLPSIDATAALLQAMPAIGEVPDDWLLFEGSDADPSLNWGSGYCLGPNWSAAAVDLGATGTVHGPNWDLPSGGWFGLSAFTFDSTNEAGAFLEAIVEQANGCMTDPVVFDTSETDYDIFSEGYGEDAVWSTAEVNGAFPYFIAGTDDSALAIYEEFISTTYGGTEFSLVRTEYQVFERYDRTVLAFWLWGEHDAVGFGNSADVPSYLPNEVDLEAATAVIRALVVEQLRADGLA